MFIPASTDSWYTMFFFFISSLYYIIMSIINKYKAKDDFIINYPYIYILNFSVYEIHLTLYTINTYGYKIIQINNLFLNK